MLRKFSMRLLPLGLMLVVGCGSAAKDKPALYKATGIVKLNGAPLAGATVAFHPVDLAKVARGGTGITDSSGKFTISTFGANDGAIEGEYKVTVTKVQMKAGIDPKSLTPGGPPGADAGGAANSEAYSKMMAPTGGAAASVTESAASIPEKYTKVEETTLRAFVDSKTANEFQYDL
jgi:hypothetical protein